MEAGTMRSEARHAVELIRTLSAVRQFTDQPLPEEAVKDIFEVIRWSGNASNRQQFQVLWIEERKLLLGLAATWEPDGLRLSFSLPAGSYATVLLRELIKVIHFEEEIELGNRERGTENRE